MEEKVGIQVHAADNVITVVADACPGHTIQYMTPQGRRRITVLDEVPFGHKVALKDIEAGETIIKYNEVIGTASMAVKGGQHVHTHNVLSAVQGEKT